MSFKVMLWAMQLRIPMSNAAFRVLNVLAERADDDGTNCYPSLEYISEWAQMDRSQVRRSIVWLETKAIISRAAGKGRGIFTQYRINLGVDVSLNGVQAHPLQGGDPAPHATKGDAATPFADLKGDAAPTFQDDKRGRGTPFKPLKGDNRPVKGGAGSPDSIQTQESKKEPPPSGLVAHGREATQPDLLGNGSVHPLPDPITEAFSVWNEVCGEQLGRVMKFTDKRRNRVGALLRKEFAERGAWRAFCQSIVASDLLCGRKINWQADFDWCIAQDHVVKILEGNRYANRAAPPKPGRENGAFILAQRYATAQATPTQAAPVANRFLAGRG